MTKTALDVATEALRHIGVTGVHETPTASDASRAKSHLDDLFETISTTEELAIEWTVETVPSGAFLPLSRMLSGSICTAYGKPEFRADYGAGLRQLRAFEFGKMKTDSQPARATYF